MWKLKIAEGKDPWLESLYNFVGRQHWEFDPDAGTPEERAEVERVREDFKRNRFEKRQSADLLMRMQMRIENTRMEMGEGIKLKEREEITEEAVVTTLKRAINFFSSIQAHDGHWPADNAGPLPIQT
ncbi:Lupeol synthase [Bienertia sinuspersici]